MKKWMSGILVLVLSASLFAACGSKKVETQQETANTQAEETTDAVPAEEVSEAAVSIKNDPEEATYQIKVAMQALLEEAYGEEVADARINVTKLYTAEEEQEEPLKSLNLTEDEVAFEVQYELLPAEDVDPIIFTAGTGVFDEESGWVKEKYNVGVLRPNPNGEPAYQITDFGTGF